MFENVKEIHLKEYLPAVIEQYGHAILHGDGNIFVDREGVEPKHQPSYLHKEFAAVRTPGEEPDGRFTIRFTKVEQIPDNLDDLRIKFLEARQKEKSEANKTKTTPDQLTMNLPKKEGEEKKPGRKPKESEQK